MSVHRRIPTLAVLLATLAALPAPCAQAAVFTVGPPGQTAGCTHATIQAAINDAVVSPGLDIIRIARGDYPAQRLVINDDDDLAIEGGFVDCATLVQVDSSTLDGQGANPDGPVVQHTGMGTLTLADLVIRNGNASTANASTTLGGGVSSTGWGDLVVYRSRFHGNRARFGGGLYVGAFLRTPKQVRLIGVGFASNIAVNSGGGLYATNVDLHITGEAVSYFSGNSTQATGWNQGGGALYALDADVRIDSPAPAAYPFMEGNWAGGSGGAIHFTSQQPGNYSLQVRTRRGRAPTTFGDNVAEAYGGAVFLRAASSANSELHVRFVDTIVSGNSASLGSAVYLSADDGNGTTNRAELAMRNGDACRPEQRCNRIDDSFGQRAPIHLYQIGSGRTEFSMERGHLTDNIVANGTAGDAGGNGLIWANGGGYIHVDNSVVAGNDLGNALLFRSPGGEVRVENSTIAGNTRIEPSLFRLYSANDELRVRNSIAFQPGKRILFATSGAPFELRNLLVGDGHSLGALIENNIQVTADPMFQNPGQNDFRPRLGSPAVNRWSAGSVGNPPLVDLLGASRPAPPTSPTPYDFGAYEYGAVVDAIFTHGFDD